MSRIGYETGCEETEYTDKQPEVPVLLEAQKTSGIIQQHLLGNIVPISKKLASDVQCISD